MDDGSINQTVSPEQNFRLWLDNYLENPLGNRGHIRDALGFLGRNLRGVRFDRWHQVRDAVERYINGTLMRSIALEIVGRAENANVGINSFMRIINEFVQAIINPAYTGGSVMQNARPWTENPPDSLFMEWLGDFFNESGTPPVNQILAMMLSCVLIFEEAENAWECSFDQCRVWGGSDEIKNAAIRILQNAQGRGVNFSRFKEIIRDLLENHERTGVEAMMSLQGSTQMPLPRIHRGSDTPLQWIDEPTGELDPEHQQYEINATTGETNYTTRGEETMNDWKHPAFLVRANDITFSYEEDYLHNFLINLEKTCKSFSTVYSHTPGKVLVDLKFFFLFMCFFRYEGGKGQLNSTVCSFLDRHTHQETRNDVENRFFITRNWGGEDENTFLNYHMHIMFVPTLEIKNIIPLGHVHDFQNIVKLNEKIITKEDLKEVVEAQETPPF